MHPAQYIFIAMMLCVLAYVALNAMGWVLRRYFVATPLTSSLAPDDSPDLAVVPPVAAMTTSGVAGVATPQNGRNDPLQIAEAATLQALARLIAESQRQPFQNGEVAETRSLKALFGVSPSSDARSEYQRLRALLKTELARLQPPRGPQFPPLTPEQEATRQALKLQ